MWNAAWTWLLGTQMGRGVLLGGSIAIGIALGWWVFSSHYYDEGVAACEAKQLSAINDANVKQSRENTRRDKASSDISKGAVSAGQKVSQDITKKSESTKEVIQYVYRDRPKTAPVAPGSCVHPLDDRVQDRIGEARRRANGS